MFFAPGGMGMTAAAVISVAAFLPLPTNADSIIYSWSPAPSVFYSSPSPGTSLVSGTRKEPSSSHSLDARYRTWEVSVSRALRSDKAGFSVILR